MIAMSHPLSTVCVMELKVISDSEIERFEPARLMALIADVQRLIDSAVAYQRKLMGVAEARRAARAVGDACVADSLVRTTGVSRRHARHAARQASVIAANPDVAAALDSGAINAEQAETIARADVPEPVRGELLMQATTQDTDVTRRSAAAAEDVHRGETPEEKFMRQHRNRYLRMWTDRHEMLRLDGALDPEAGARLQAVVGAVSKRLWKQDKRLPAARRRTPQQRDIDALTAVAAPVEPRSQAGTSGSGPTPATRDRHNRRAEPSQAGPSGERANTSQATRSAPWGRVTPTLQVNTSYDALRSQLDRAGVTASGQQFSAETLRRLACDAEIIPAVLNSRGRVIDVGRRNRVIGEALRAVLWTRDGGCVWPGCDASVQRCDGHHVRHWVHGGRTDADNLALLCHRHHILLHEGGYRLAHHRHRDGWIVLTKDDQPLHSDSEPAHHAEPARRAEPACRSEPPPDPPLRTGAASDENYRQPMLC